MHRSILTTLLQGCLLLGGLLMAMPGAEAQRFVMRNGQINACEGTFFDSGGNTDRYANNENYTFTICPDLPGARVEVFLQDIDLGRGDTLYYYNATTARPDSLLRFSVAEEAVSSFSVSATPDNPSGCLTFVFRSDGAFRGEGWRGLIDCAVNCQPVVARIDSTDPAAQPDANGWIDICPGTDVTFNGSAEYPANNGQGYVQSDASSTFIWEFSNGERVYGPSTSYVFNEPGGYQVRLLVRDTFGCTNTNFISQRIRVAVPPQITHNLPDSLCIGESVDLVAGTAPTADVRIQPGQGEFSPFANITDTISLPDGTGTTYTTSLSLSDFAPGQTLTDIDDLQRICVDMEHSWMYDLEIFLTCPNGQRVMLQEQEPISDEIHLGTPYELDDNQSTSIPGTGATYCWTSAASQTWNEYVDDNTTIFTSFPFDLPAGNYASFEPLDQLLGCPLNGEWILTVQDLWEDDNGWIFSWGIDFEDGLYPVAETFTSDIVDLVWSVPTTLGSNNGPALTLSPTAAGTYTYQLQLRDSTGCVTDTSLVVNVRAAPPPPTVVCTQVPGGIRFDWSSSQGYTSFEYRIFFRGQLRPWDTVSNGMNTMIIAAGPGEEVVMEVRGIGEPGISCSGSISSTSCTVSTDCDFDLLIERVRPVSCAFSQDGLVEFSLSGNTSGVNLLLNNQPLLNPDTLRRLWPGQYVLTARGAQCTVRDTFIIAAPDELVVTINSQSPACPSSQDGSIGAVASGGTGNYTYRWSTGENTAAVANLGVGEYCLTVTDAAGCQEIVCDTLTTITGLFIDSIAARPVSCFGGTDGQATAIVSGGTMPYEYDWDDALQQISDTAFTLSAGAYRLTVTDALGCQVTGSVSIAEPSRLSLDFAVQNETCRDDRQGRIELQATGATAPYTYRWEDGATSPQRAMLLAGNYTFTITDANGCTLTDSLRVQQPSDSLRVEATQSRAGCNGESGNSATVTVSGGYGSYTYRWSTGMVSPRIENVPAATYTLTVTDAGGCTQVDTVTVSDLTDISFGLIADSPTCQGDNNGAMGINQLIGGAGTDESDYRYQWSTGGSAIAITGLAGGQQYSVTVSDSRGCTATRTRFLPDAIPISFDVDAIPVSCAGGSDGGLRLYNFVGPNDSLFTIRWGFGGGTTDNPVRSLTAGDYAVTVTDQEGCSLIRNISVPEPAPLRLSFSRQNVLCYGAPDGSATVAVAGGVPDYRLQWSNGDTSTTIVNLGVGTYFVTVTDANGCTTDGQVTLQQPTNFDAGLNVTNVSCAESADGRIDLMPVGGTPPFTYRLNNQNFTTSAVFVGLAPGNYGLQIRDAAGCTYRVATAVVAPAPFTVQAGEDQRIFFGDSLTLTAAATNASGDVEFVWLEPYPGTLGCTECTQTLVRPAYTTDYELYGIDANGCEATDRVRVYVDRVRSVEVPTGFTPNADNTNDRLIVHGLPGTQVLLFRVYDRWGELVHESGDFPVNERATGWDGNWREQLAPGGVYLWQLNVRHPDGSEESLQGQTTLIR